MSIRGFLTLPVAIRHSLSYGIPISLDSWCNVRLVTCICSSEIILVSIVKLNLTLMIIITYTIFEILANRRMI